MQGRAKNISIKAVRKANGKLVSGRVTPLNVVSDNSKNGNVVFRAMFRGKAYDLNITKAKIRASYAKSIAETIS